MSGNLDKSKLSHLARLATKAASTRYQHAEESVVKSRNHPWSLFSQPKPSPLEVFSSAAYKENNLETTRLRYQQFEDELYLVVLALDKDIKLSEDITTRAAQERSIREIIKTMYQHVFLNNQGENYLYNDFYDTIHLFLGQPYLNTLDKSVKAQLITAGLGILCLAVAASCSFLGASFASVIFPLIVTGFAALIANLMLKAAENIYNMYASEYDSYILPPDPTLTASFYKTPKIVCPKNIIYPDQIPSAPSEEGYNLRQWL